MVAISDSEIEQLMNLGGDGDAEGDAWLQQEQTKGRDRETY